MTRRRLALAVVAALTAAVPAAAQERAAADSVRSLVERGCCLDEVRDGAEVKDFKIHGNRALDDKTIRNALYTDKSGFFPWSSEHQLSKSEFRNDLVRVHILYQRHGYFDARLVDYAVRPTGTDEVEVSLTVSEGEPTRVDSLTVATLEEVADAPPMDELRQHVPLQVGRVFTELELLAGRDTLEALLKNRGHAYAQVLLEYRIRREQRTATLTYTADPGDVYWIGDVRIRGYEGDDPKLILRQIRFKRGDRYDRQDILDSQRRIYELGLFRRVEIEPQLASARGDTVDVRVDVTPAPTHVVRVGVGYGTEDLFRARASWLDRNLLGEGRQLEVRGEYSRIDREGAVTYRQPSFLLSDVSLSATAFLRFEIETNYTVERIGTSTRVGYRLNRNIQSRFGFNAERVDFSEFDAGVLIPEFGREFVNPSRLVYAEAVATFDNTDSLFGPSRGYRANLGYQAGLPVVGADYAYHRVTFEVTHYRRVREGWVLALKVLPGAIFTYGGENARVPLFQRLFAGGATSVRGYERRQLGPKDDPEAFGQERDPEPVGGRGLFESTVELRFPIRGNWRGAAFVDAGNVWDDPGDVSPGDLKYAPGAGVRYTTPVGPVRLDVAWRMSDDEEDAHLPSWAFHISIGNAF